METIDLLTKSNVPTKKTAAWPPQRRPSRSTTSDEPSREDSAPNLTPLIIAKPHPVDVFSILATAPDPETRSAWLEGTPPTAADVRSLRLEEHEHATDGPLRPSKDNTNRVWLDLFEEGRRWRERG